MGSISLIVAIAALIVAAFSIWQMIVLKRRFDAALTNATGEKIEKTLSNHFAKVQDAENHLSKLDQAYKNLADQASLASQKISIVRFNPFADTGGDQSFVLAVLDSHDSGYCLTSIHGRGGTRVYVKPIDYGKSKYPLSEEEKQALAQAAKRVPVKQEATRRD